MVITQEQMDLMLSGINDGLTIDQCCKYILHISRRNFYKYATNEQKMEIKSCKVVNSGFFNDSLRSREVVYNRKHEPPII
jgi:hypothetical protein